MKYLIVKKMGLEVGIIFGEILSHKEVARIHNCNDVTVVSAGFCADDDNGLWTTWGESVSLDGMKSRPIDAQVLNRSMR